MENFSTNNPVMGVKPSNGVKLSKLAKGLILGLILIVVAVGIYIWQPGLGVSESVTGNAIALDGVNIDNVMNTEKLPLPSKEISNAVAGKPVTKIGVYAWNAISAFIAANGGPKTTSGSLMEQNGVNVEIIRQDWLSELRNMQVKFVTDLDSGKETKQVDDKGKEVKSVAGIIIMGDGAPFYISTTQKSLDDKFGKDKYHLQVVGAVGISYGEDKLIGPMEWKTNPKSMLGSVISVVVGDGDWVTTLNFCFANGLKVNPDFTTYDPNAVNFYPSENDDYMKSAEELIKSQKGNLTVDLKEIKDGKLTGNVLKRKIDGCATWTPGDKKVFDELSGFTDIVSTKEFNNQMPATLIVVKEWADKNPSIVTNMLKATYEAANQMKLFDEWRVSASEAVSTTYGIETPEYWYKMFRGQTGEKNGIKYSVGGSRVFNLADAKQYYGLGNDGVSRYKAVYEQVTKYLVELNPFNFNSNVDEVTPFDKAVNLSYLQNINMGSKETGDTYVKDYSKTATDVIAKGDWSINFNVGSADVLSSSNADLDKIYNLLSQAEDTKVILEGHTDSTGDATINKSLSEKRAYTIKDYLIRKGLASNRIQEVTGYGSDKPIGDNSTTQGRAKNRRTTVILLK